LEFSKGVYPMNNIITCHIKRYENGSNRPKFGCQYRVISMLREQNCIGEYITKQLGTSRQNSLKCLRKLEKKGFAEVRSRDRQTILWGITSLGLKTDRLYKIACESTYNSLISPFLSKNRYHRFRILFTVDRIFPNGFESKDGLVVSSNTVVGSCSYSTFDFSKVASVFEKIEDRVYAFCALNGLNVLEKDYYVDVAQIRRKKKLIDEFKEYSEWVYDCSLGFPERERTFEFDMKNNKLLE
jgi:hypothetical protein